MSRRGINRKAEEGECFGTTTMRIPVREKSCVKSVSELYHLKHHVGAYMLAYLSVPKPPTQNLVHRKGLTRTPFPSFFYMKEMFYWWNLHSCEFHHHHLRDTGWIQFRCSVFMRKTRPGTTMAGAEVGAPHLATLVHKNDMYTLSSAKGGSLWLGTD